MRRLLPVIAGVVILAAGLFGVRAIFTERDSGGGIAAPAATGPGVLESQPGDPPTSGTPGAEYVRREGAVDDPALVGALAAGNVALVYSSAKPPRELVALRETALGGGFDPELAAAGQMIVLVRRPGEEGIQALAWKRRLTTPDPADPQLAEFVDAWLGKGDGATGQ